jgi:hypothetical protein
MNNKNNKQPGVSEGGTPLKGTTTSTSKKHGHFNGHCIRVMLKDGFR